MTLPASFPLSMAQIAAEIGKTLPLSLLDPTVVSLANKTGAPVSFSDLLGKSGRIDSTGTVVAGSGLEPPGRTKYVFSLNPFFGGTASLFTADPATGLNYTLTFATAPTNFSGSILVTSNYSGTQQSIVVSKINSTQWYLANSLIGILPSVGNSVTLHITPF